jgi:S-DNA-T family DNA segregation ATPase FtsK/SpoIIIE
VPEQQRQVEFGLRWSDEHVALLGGPRADLNTALVTIACSAAVSHTPDDLHIYAIDFTGRGLARISQLPHCGGVASRNDRLAVRIARHLVDEVALRRSELASEGVSTLEELAQRTGQTFPHVLVLVSGAEKLSSIVSTDEPSAAAGPLATIIADGSGLGIQVVASGLPAFAMYRPGSYIDRRVVFEAADMSDYLSLGCPRPLMGELRGARRGVDVTSRLAVQICSLAGGEVNEADVLDGLVHRLQQQWSPGTVRRPPVEIAEVAWPTRVSSLATAIRTPPARAKLPLLVGVDNESGAPVWIDASECGGSFFVAGGRRTGRSSALVTLGLLARHLGWDVVGVAPSPNSPLHERACPFDVVELAEIDDRPTRPKVPTMVLLDDLQRLEGRGESVVSKRFSEADLVVVSGPVATMGMQRPLVDLGASRATCGIVLVPESHADFELAGARADRQRSGGQASRRPGQGLMGVAGEVFDLTMPLVDV